MVLSSFIHRLLRRPAVRRWIRLPVILAALAGALLALGAVGLARMELQDEAETVTLGTGIAGVDETPAAAGRTPRAGAAKPVERERKPARPEAPAAELLGSGEASFYHSSLEGRPTASGESYRGGNLTAAHRTLPFGSRVRVTNLSNGRTVTVRINDRGPFVGRRVIDLSRSAASKLGMLNRGRAKVRLELIE